MRRVVISLAVLAVLVGGVVPTQAQAPVSGTLGVAAATVTANIDGAPSAAIQLSGTWSGTVTFEASVAGAWTALNVVRQSTYALGSTTTANDLYLVDNPGFAQIRVRMSAYTSGTATVSILAGKGKAPAPALVAASGNLFTRTGTTIAVTTPGDTLGDVASSGQVLVREAFKEPLAVFEQDFTAKALTDGATNYVLGSPLGLITYREEQAKTASSWVVAANKLDITADNTTNDEGVEILIGDGLLTDVGSAWLLTGTTGGCFTVNFTVALIAGTDQFVIGWRQHEAFVSDNVYTGYTDWSVVGINNVDGSIFSLGEVAGGGTLSDDSGVNAANGGTYTLKSCIDATTRVPSAFLDGTAITLANGATAKTAATLMNPFISYMAVGTTDANIRVNWLQVTR